ncbi:hypothetical protein Poli38472_014684 [Pythium oligandrum]|uniref:Uncharacterized protein n=1 Tax=Pythium oligandrum TaxID=41045 RepID=A0A8K1CJ34_PYTOL|nr:hypothetical protein Poli38472_014684 [Pythium oligandrum]|eukprot:TMW63979.1 hypothetical protein Poli38472_014684 [Pythium oligandrum]
MNSDRSFLMPTKYSRVLDKITEMRQERPNQLIKDRIRQTFVHLPQLQDELMQTVDGLTQEESETILETLHDLGDVLWYARDGLDVLGDAVILSASMLIDFIRQIVCHDPTKLAGAGSSGFIDNQLVEDMEQGGKIAHELLRSFSLWKRLEYPDQMLHFKQLLQRFRLAFPAGKNEMKADSGLIVPAYWRVRKNQVKLDELEPLVNKLDGYEPEELTHFHWEDDFHHELVETAFEQLAVESYAVFDEREIHGHCIESVENGEFAVRIALGTHGLDSQKRQVILLEVVSIDRELATEYLRLLHEVAGIVLDAYPGLYASCVAVVKRRRHRIDEAIQKLQTATPARRAFLERQYSWLPADVASWYRREKKTKQNSVPLTSPPDLQKITSMYNRQRSMYNKMELMLTKSDDTKETMVNLHAGAGNHRDLPALWMVERVLKPKSKLIVWILSEISGRCFHKPIEFEVSSKFLAAHGDKLTTGLSVFANAIPDEIPVLPMVKDVILGAVSELGTRSQCAARMHSMVDQLDLSTGGVISSNQSRTLPPAESYNLLQKILNEYDENFTTHSISTLTNLECGTTKDGKYQWAHREEHSCCQNHLRIEYTNASVASNPLTSPSAASTAWMSMSKSESSNFYMCNFVIDGLAAGKYWRRAYCVWEIREQQGTTVLESGETIQNPHEDPQQQSQWLQSFVLTKMTSAETLSTCELVVTLKRPSRLSLRSDKIIGSGSIKLSDYYAQDAGQKFACDRLVIPLSEQKASIYCHLCAFESQ